MKHGRFSLRTLIFGGGALLMLLPALIASILYTGALQARSEQLLVEKLTARGELSANLLARRLHQLWQEVDNLAGSIDLANSVEIRRDIDFISSLDQRYSWIGITDVEGRVIVSMRGMLEGQSVAQRPWFRRGLTGPTAIDVHEAQLLAKLLPATSDPYRFIDLAAPLRKSGGPAQGVVGAHLDWRWVQDNLAGLQAPGIDVMLLSRERNVLYGPANLVDKPLSIGSAQAANRTTTAVFNERWPDGKSYLTVVIPTVGYADLPSFGWSLLIRQNLDEALAPTRELMREYWLTLGTGAILSLLLLALGAQWITVPLRRLAGSAEAIVEKADQQAPYTESRYEEAARLSNALVRLQSKLLRRPGS